MNNLELSLVIWTGACAAGFLGALTGLGGGVVIVPMLVLLSVDIRYAIGAALISVIATSSGAAAAYVKQGYANVRIGIFLEVATTLGAVTGAHVATAILSHAVIAVIFGVFLLLSAFLSLREKHQEIGAVQTGRYARLLRLDGSYPTPAGPVTYHVKGVPWGFSFMYLAGVLSGLLGIGSGAVKVLAMDHAMRIPFKVSTTTSNFMIGVTAAASAGLYLHRGYIKPEVAMPVMLGVLPGALLGTTILVKAKTHSLRRVFCVVLIALAAQMIYHGVARWL